MGLTAPAPNPGDLPSTLVVYRDVGDRFSVAEGVIDRIWCGRCHKSAHLADRDEATIRAMTAVHQCGPRAALWDSTGVGR